MCEATIPAALIVLASPTATHWLMHAVCAMATVLAVRCAGVPNGDALVDACDVCDGDGSGYADCAGVQMVLRSSMHVACVKAMIPAVPTVLVFPMVRRFSMHAASAKAMVQLRRLCRCSNGIVLDACGVCDGDGSSCADCASVSTVLRS